MAVTMSKRNQARLQAVINIAVHMTKDDGTTAWVLPSEVTRLLKIGWHETTPAPPKPRIAQP